MRDRLRGFAQNLREHGSIRVPDSHLRGQLESNGGFSHNERTQQPAGKGWFASDAGTETQAVAHHMFNEPAIAQHRETHRETLQQPGKVLGGWRSGVTDFVDVSTQFDSPRGAIAHGQANNQYSIYGAEVGPKGQSYTMEVEGNRAPKHLKPGTDQHQKWSHAETNAKRAEQSKLNTTQWEQYEGSDLSREHIVNAGAAESAETQKWSASAEGVFSQMRRMDSRDADLRRFNAEADADPLPSVPDRSKNRQPTQTPVNAGDWW